MQYVDIEHIVCFDEFSPIDRACGTGTQTKARKVISIRKPSRARFLALPSARLPTTVTDF